MKRTDFSFELPEDLIAQHPPSRRGDSRLLALNGESGAVAHHRFEQLLELLNPSDLLVFNDTRVIPARLFGRKASGGRVEILIERLTGPHTALAHVRSSKSPRPGALIELLATDGGEFSPHSVEVTGREGAFFCIRSASGHPLVEVLSHIGHMPLPPYITRADEEPDRARYQTVYAQKDGAVAAPTAGLHFTEELLAAIDAKGVQRTAVTLHVGAGTFQPVRVDDIEEHDMHAEYLEVGEPVCAAVHAAKARGGRVIAVGTTAVRSLETAARNGNHIAPFAGDTDIFIYPGYRFRVVDALVTNFHLPESTLLMLVSAFATREHTMGAYREAIEQRYRFFSYGDAMFITANPQALS